MDTQNWSLGAIMNNQSRQFKPSTAMMRKKSEAESTAMKKTMQARSAIQEKEFEIQLMRMFEAI
jgi:hypothetical protein